MTDRIRERADELDVLKKAADEILSRAKGEKRSLNDEEIAKVSDLLDRADRVAKEIDFLHRSERAGPLAAEALAARTASRPDSPETAAAVSADPKERVEQEKRAWSNWLRVGRADLSAEDRAVLAPLEHRAQAVGTGSAGGYTVPQGFYPVLEDALKQFGAMFSVATILETETGSALPMTTANDTAQVGVILAENTGAANQDIPFAQIELDFKDWRRVLRQARASGLTLLVEAFDRPSLELAAEEQADGFKVHTTDMENPDFVRAVGALGKPRRDAP